MRRLLHAARRSESAHAKTRWWKDVGPNVRHERRPQAGASRRSRLEGVRSMEGLDDTVGCLGIQNAVYELERPVDTLWRRMHLQLE